MTSSVFYSEHPILINEAHRVMIYHGYLPPSNTEILAKVQHHPTSFSYPRISPIHVTKNRLQQPFICQVFDCSLKETPDGVWSTLIIERMSADLVKEIECRASTGDYWSEAALLWILHSLLTALHYAESRHISHGNIRPENLYVNAERNVIKLGVFAQAVSEMGRTVQPTLLQTPLSFLSPERRDAHSSGSEAESTDIDPYKADIYSVGASMLFMVHLVSPKYDITPSQFQDMRNYANYPLLQSYLRAMTEANPGDRPTYNQLLSQLEVNQRSEIATSELPTQSIPELPLQPSSHPVVIPASKPLVDIDKCVGCDSNLLGSYFSIFNSRVEISCGHQFHSKSCFDSFVTAMVACDFPGTLYCPRCSQKIDFSIITHVLGKNAIQDKIDELMRICDQCEGTAILRALDCDHSVCKACWESVALHKGHCKKCLNTPTITPV